MLTLGKLSINCWPTSGIGIKVYSRRLPWRYGQLLVGASNADDVGL